MTRWLPLESNPEVMNKYLGKLGVPNNVQVHDVIGLDEDLLALVPSPVYALLLLYPITDKSNEFNEAQESGIDDAGQTLSEELYFMKQFVGNACGTIALLHAVANSTSRFTLDDGPLKTFLDKTKDSTPDERGHLLEDEEDIFAVHEDCAGEGQSATRDRDEKMDTHFVAFVNVENGLYELDGRKKYPINHGSTDDENFLIDATNVVRQFIERDTQESRFAVLALCGS